MDMLAVKAGIDPLEFRYLNAWREGDVANWGGTLDCYPYPAMGFKKLFTPSMGRLFQLGLDELKSLDDFPDKLGGLVRIYIRVRFYLEKAFGQIPIQPFRVFGSAAKAQYLTILGQQGGLLIFFDGDNVIPEANKKKSRSLFNLPCPNNAAAPATP